MTSQAITFDQRKESFCFFFQKEALSYFFMHASGSFLKKRTKKLSFLVALG
jgi:hypothetical protein